MKFKANLLYKPGNFQMDDCQVEKVVELTHEEFCRMKITPMAEPFIAENKSCMFTKDGISHCLLALGEGERDGILIQSFGYDYPRTAAYIPGMRDIVNAEMERAADLIIQKCTENTGADSWQVHFNDRPARGSCCVSFEVLEQQLGLTIREGNGLDAMLLGTLRRRPEVTSVELSHGWINTDYDFGPHENAATQKKKRPVIFTTRWKADLFENAVSTVCEIFRGEDLYAMLHDSFGLTLQEIRSRGYMSDREIAQTCGVPGEMLDCDMAVRDILKLDGLSGSACLFCDGSDRLVSLEGLRAMGSDGQNEFAALLDAWVADIRMDGKTKLALAGVEAAELERLYDAIEAQAQAEQAMEPTM